MTAMVALREVGLRDGLQLAKSVLSTDIKVEWAERVARAGVPEIEVASFVPPHVVPQFSDAKELVGRLAHLGDIAVSTLVPNLKGAQLAIDAGCNELNFVMSVSEAHNLANVRKTVEQSVEELTRIAELRKAGARFKINGGLATAFGCSFSGNVPQKNVVALAVRLAEVGADEINLADTVGYGNPRQVKAVAAEVARELPGIPLRGHFHDTRGLGLANVVAALEAGVTHIDAAIGGLGGCPFAPGATGNIDMEDTAFLLESMGVRTGVDLGALIELRKLAEGWMPQDVFYGSLVRAGLPTGFRPASVV